MLFAAATDSCVGQHLWHEPQPMSVSRDRGSGPACVVLNSSSPAVTTLVAQTRRGGHYGRHVLTYQALRLEGYERWWFGRALAWVTTEARPHRALPFYCSFPATPRLIWCTDGATARFCLSLASRPLWYVDRLPTQQQKCVTRGGTAMHEHETPLTPVYGFNSPSAPITLYEGAVTKGSHRYNGKIELKFTSKPSLCWSVNREDSELSNFGKDSVELRFDGRSGQVSAEAHFTDESSGWINEVSVGQGATRLKRVLIHWFNLPDILGNQTLKESGEFGEAWWAGRLHAEISGWVLTLDERRDYSESAKEANGKNQYLMTHVMEARRSDGEEFSVDAVSELIECIRVCLSFGFGRWVAPGLPVGFDNGGRIVWEHWASPICDPFTSVGSGWLYKTRSDDLISLIDRGMSAFGDSSRPGITRFQMCLAVQAVGSGFLEQRVLAAAPALESLAWSSLVLGQKMTSDEYRDRYAEDRLRYLLQAAGVPVEIDSELLPGLASFAHSRKIDGPTAITRVRNNLVHPEDPHEQIYRHDGLILDAWFLSLHYVRLLILHSIGYLGSYTKLHKRGWAGDAVPVPWVTGISPLTTPPLPMTRSAARRSRRNPRPR